MVSANAQGPVRLASVGVGFWGTTLAEGARAAGNVKIVACYAPTEAHARDFAARYGCAVAPSYEAILADPQVEGVLLTTPNSLHRAQIEAAAQHGKHVFVEKPITLTVADAQAATRICAQAGVVLAVGHQDRRTAGIRMLKSLIDSGELGQVVGAEANISTNTGTTVTPGTWRWGREECPGGPLIQIGIHKIDDLCYLLGPIARVFGIQRHRVIAAEIDDASVTLLEFENGAIGQLTSHYATARIMEVRLIGTKANASYDRGLGVSIRRDARNRAVVEVLQLAETDPVCEEIAEFARCIRTGGRPEVGGEEATYALAVVLAAVESNRQDRPVLVRSLLESRSETSQTGRSTGGAEDR